MSLPDDYRAFLVELGNGGAGPNYGVARLEPFTPEGFPKITVQISSKDGTKVSAGTGARSSLERRARMSDVFPLEAAWRVGSPVPDLGGANPYDGCVYLSEIGCGYYDFLVLRGPRAGEVWTDDTAAMEGGGIRPTARTFRDWYEAWLDPWVVDTLVNRVRRSLGGERLDSETHEVVVAHAPLVAPGSDAIHHGFRVLVELYLENRDRAETLLQEAEERWPGAPALKEPRRFVYRSDFEAAASTDREALARVVHHASSDVRQAVAENPNADTSLLDALAKDVSANVRASTSRVTRAPRRSRSKRS